MQRLRQRDTEVRQHEAAHRAAAGQYANGAPTYSYTTGPDGRRYATSGEVSIDTGEESTPEQTLEKAHIIRRAALAPAEPSNQDRQVAAAASRLETKARRELAEQSQGNGTEKEQGASDPASNEIIPPRLDLRG